MFKLREKWRSAVCDITERTQQKTEVPWSDQVYRKTSQNHSKSFLWRYTRCDWRHKGEKIQNRLSVYEIKQQDIFVTAVTPVAVNTETNMISNAKQRGDKFKGASNTVNRDAFIKPCAFFKGDHVMEACQAMSKIHQKEKIEFLKKHGLCYACLVKGHISQMCKKWHTCNSCKKNHPTVLHIENFTSEDPWQARKILSSRATLSQALWYQQNTQGQKPEITSWQLYLKANKGNSGIEKLAFLNPGSTTTSCTEKLMEPLSVRGKRTDSYSEQWVMKSLLNVCSLDGNTFIELPEVFTQNAIPVSQENIPTEMEIKGRPYLKDVHIKSITAEVDRLIGANIPKALEPLKVTNSQGEGPYAVLTRLGWIINGPLGNTAPADEDGRPRITSNRISVSRWEELFVRPYNQDSSELAFNEKQEHSFEDKKMIASGGQLSEKERTLRYNFHSVRITSVYPTTGKWQNKEH